MRQDAPLPKPSASTHSLVRVTITSVSLNLTIAGSIQLRCSFSGPSSLVPLTRHPTCGLETSMCEAVLNGLVMVTYINQLWREGAWLEDAIVQGSLTQLRLASRRRALIRSYRSSAAIGLHRPPDWVSFECPPVTEKILVTVSCYAYHSSQPLLMTVCQHLGEYGHDSSAIACGAGASAGPI
jgi:hypothetical protein